MTDIKTIFKQNKFPSFISTADVFKKNKEIKKVFPDIGLPNVEKEMEVDNSKDAIKSAKTLTKSIAKLVDKRFAGIDKFKSKKEQFNEERKKKIEDCKKILKDFKSQINDDCVVANNGKMTLNLKSDIADTDGKVLFKSGEGVFKVYNKINEILKEGKFVAMENLDNNAAFKIFSSKNMPSIKYKIVFSSDGSKGLWDIATMSMRGVESCQSWNGSYSRQLIGSIADPFTGIIYLTNDKKHNEHGTKMLRRCVVRLIVDKKTKKPHLALENMYPSYDAGTMEAFKAFLKEQTKNQFNVLYLPKQGGSKYFLPRSRIVSDMPAAYKTYTDSGVQYGDINDKANISVTELENIKIYCLKKIATTIQATKNSLNKNYSFNDTVIASFMSVYDAADANGKTFLDKLKNIKNVELAPLIAKSIKVKKPSEEKVKEIEAIVRKEIDKYLDVKINSMEKSAASIENIFAQFLI